MVSALVEAGYEVTGLDTGYFQTCTIVSDSVEVPWIQKDIRDLELDDLVGYDAVIHLAALSNDPTGNLNASWTEEINYHASVRLAELAKLAGIERFIFSSSCIMYGMVSEAATANEDSLLDPKTEYAKSKVKSEQAISQLAGDGFSPVFLRNGTVYGLSPRMRFDTVLNNLVGQAITTGKIILYGNGEPWRPVIHIQDVAQSFIAIMKAPTADVHNQAFNNGANHLNYQIIKLAEIVVQMVPGCDLEILSKADADQRTYKADFGKFTRVFPNFEFEWTAEKGARQLYQIFTSLCLTNDVFTSPRFTRMKWLCHLMETRQLDRSLRWHREKVSGQRF